MGGRERGEEGGGRKREREIDRCGGGKGGMGRGGGEICGERKEYTERKKKQGMR